MSNDVFINSFGDYTLERLPKTQKGDLRAWDAADELLLNHLHTEVLINKTTSFDTILIINDQFGALSTALHQLPLHNWSDSHLAHLAAKKNITSNQLTAKIEYIPAHQELELKYKLVIIKVPKALSLLEDQLCRLKPHITTDTIIIGSAMSKHIHTSTLKLFEKIIGSTHTSRATKKARLIFSKPDNHNACKSPYPKTITDEQLTLTLINHANVFSKNHLDIGSRFLISQLTHCPKVDNIIDLGCGNGALGIMAKRLQKKSKISFIDESYMAIKSAKENWRKEGYSNNDAEFYSSDCLSHYNGEKVGLILCNPPFHQAHSIGDQIAWEMFKQSVEHLEDNGELWVVGNRHLAYHIKLKRLFGNCKTIASNKKFVVLVAQKHSKSGGVYS